MAKGESIGIVVALIVMLVVFGTLVAAGLPIVLTIVTLLVTMGIAMATSHVFGLNAAVVQMIGMIGLAVGIDYTLFIVSRYREERERGLTIVDAITRAGDTASKAVLFSGLTVIVSLLGMLVVPWNLMTSVLGAITVVLVSVLMTLTLLPAVLRLLGDRINRGKLPFIGYQRATASVDQQCPLRLLDLVVPRRDAPASRQPGRLSRPPARPGQLHLLDEPRLRQPEQPAGGLRQHPGRQHFPG